MSISTETRIRHYQNSIDRCLHDKDRLLYCIGVLNKLPVTVEHLQTTGIGRTVNALRKIEDGVGEAAKHLVNKWKTMVQNNCSSEEEEDEACIPDAPECYASSDSSPVVAYNSGILSDHGETNNEASTSDNEEKPVRDKYETHSSKDKSSKRDSDSKSPSKSKHSSSREKHEPSASSSSSTKRKYDSSSSDEDADKQKRIKSEIEEEDENNFVIDDEQAPATEDMIEEQDYREEKKMEKTSSLKGESHCDKSKSKEKNHSSYPDSKSKSHESSDKSKRSEKYSSSKSDKSDKEEKHKSGDHRSKESSKSKTCHSSSSSKDRYKEKNENSNQDKHKDKHKHSKDKVKESSSKTHKGKETSHTSSSSKDGKDVKGKCKENAETKVHKENKLDKGKHDEKKKEIRKSSNDGIDCNSGTSFADALGMCTMLPPSKKKKENSSKPNKTEQSTTSSSSMPSSSRSSTVKAKNESFDNELPELPLLSPNVTLEPLNTLDEEVNLASTLPEPSPYYKPLQPVNYLQRRQDEDDMLSQVIHAKNQRTKVFSGNKTTTYTSIPTLYEMCIRVLIENIDALEFTGGVPYYILKPVLQRATIDQLFMLEYHNPYLIEESDSIWKFHCNKDFRTKQREENETWREMYMRCLDERELKLKTLTANIKQSIDKSTPVRSTKLAYIDNVVKPPRNVLRKQAKYGTAHTATNASDLKKKLITSGAGSSSESSSSTSQAERISVPPPPPNARSRVTAPVKKIKAPLMAKALQAIKGRYKR